MTLAMLWGLACPLAAQQSLEKGRVSMQTALNDSTFFNVRLSFEAGGEGILKLESAYVTKRGSLKRIPVETTGLHYEFGKMSRTSFVFSVLFSFDRLRYRAQGRYAQGGLEGPECTLRCIPMRLSDRTLRESEYQDSPL
jgi:hypothetical protein